MAEYQLTASEEPCAVIRYTDKAHIPPDMANRDYNGDPESPGYLQWKEGGGVPDPYVPPETSPAQPSDAQVVAFDHENRIRTLEGQPPLTLEDFTTRKVIPTAPKKRK